VFVVAVFLLGWGWLIGVIIIVRLVGRFGWSFNWCLVRFDLFRVTVTIFAREQGTLKQFKS
jgi:hypothetical protein